MKFASLKYDSIFREVFSHEEVLRQFISDVTGIPLGSIQSVRVTTPFLPKEYRKQKQGILDIALVLNDDTKMDIELQIRVQKYWIKRNLFYIAQMYTNDLQAGQEYEHLKKCITISILDFSLTEGEEYHSVYTLRDAAGRELTDLFEVHIIELNKKLKNNEAIDGWIQLFNAESVEELDMIKTKKEGILYAIDQLKTFGLIGILKWEYQMRQKAIRDRKGEDAYIRDEGRAEGRTLGETMKCAENILRLLERNGEIPCELRERVMTEKDMKILDAWLIAAADAKSIEDFEEGLHKGV